MSDEHDNELELTVEACHLLYKEIEDLESKLKASQDEVSRLKAYVYEIAEIALMEGADEFGYS